MVVSGGEIVSTQKVGWFIKAFSVFLFLLSIFFIFDQLSLFIENHKYVKLLETVDNLRDYGLSYLSADKIFISVNMIMIYLLFLFSFISIHKSFKNSKSSYPLISISFLLFLILFLSAALGVSTSSIYSGTYYQDNGYYNGAVYKGSARDILISDKSIKENNMELCLNVGYKYYRDYCIKKITELN